jgi:hypothetical protein
VYGGRCTNCHESLYIMDQYYEQDMVLPAPDTEFMQQVAREGADVERRRRNRLLSGAQPHPGDRTDETREADDQSGA